MKSSSVLSLALLLLAAACSPAADPTPPPVTVSRTALPASPAFTLPPPTAAETLPATETPTPAATAASVQPTPEPTASPCSDPVCVYSGSLIFIPPVPQPGNDKIDATYRFGSTQGQLRDPHHGVEFLNSIGTPVIAAANGVVVVAGDDRKEFQGPYSYFYGNLVIVRHDSPPGLPELAGPLFSVYGHLSEILVKEGEVVQQGQTIGRVGMSGIATGSHLHFEVRAGANTYKHSSNPELWLQARPGSDAEHGAFAGRVLDSWGTLLDVENVALERLNDSGQPTGFTVFVRTYEEKILLAQPPFRENFAAGGLPAGRYRISFAKYGYQQFEVEIFPGQLTLATFVVGQ